jgi:hypothetical protein
LRVSTNTAFVLLMIGTVASVCLAGRMAERRGRSFVIWGWVAAFIGPLALPLLLLFPNLRRNNGGHA